MIFRISSIIAVLLLTFAMSYLYGDAYLAEYDIHYGADSYKVNYEKEVITAIGNAYFRKKEKLLLADKIIIYYSKNISRAECYGNVILKDEENNSVIKGHYGFVKYIQKLYFLSGNVSYKGINATITSDKVYYYSDQNRYLFEGEVVYSNKEYTITSDTLNINNDKASFYNNVKLINNEKSEILYSKSMEYNLQNNNSLFEGNVIYQNNYSDNHFMVTADAIKYIEKLNTYYLINNVFILSDKYRINADFMVYDSEKDYLKAEGNVIASGNSFIIRGDMYTIDNISREIDFLRDIKGVYKIGPD